MKYIKGEKINVLVLIIGMISILFSVVFFKNLILHTLFIFIVLFSFLSLSRCFVDNKMFIVISLLGFLTLLGSEIYNFVFYFIYALIVYLSILFSQKYLYRVNVKESKLLDFLFTILLFKMFDIFYEILVKSYEIFYSVFYVSGIISADLFYIFICGLIILFLLTLFNNLHKVNIFLVSVFSILLIVNVVKVMYTGNPVTVSDIMMVFTGSKVGEFLDSNIIYLFFDKILFFIIISIILGLIINVSSKKFNEKYFVSKKCRYITLVITFIILLILLVPNRVVHKVVIEDVFKVSTHKDYNGIASVKSSYNMFGVVLGGYKNYVESFRFEPDNYDENEIAEILNKEYELGDKSLKKPNIIMVFSESFWDVTKVDGIKFDKEVIPNFKSLKKEGKLINLVSPTLGGYSANVEFEVLTGNSMNYLSLGTVPYINIYSNKNAYKYPSVIKELKNNGYKTNIVAAASGTLFSTSSVYENMRVDNYRFLNDEMGKNVSDKELVDIMIDDFDKKDDNPYFYLLVTMDGHMPYDRVLKNKKVKLKESKYDKKNNVSLENYANKIYKADKEIKRLYDYINTLEEDTILIYLGDHLPYFTNAGKNNIYNNSNYFNGKDEYLNLYHLYNTEALILSNYGVSFDNTKYLGNDMLMPYLMHNMDLNLSNYYHYLYSIKDKVGASNPYVTIINDEIMYTNEVKNKSILEREKVQYRVLND